MTNETIIQKLHISNLKQVLSAASKDLDEVFESLVLQQNNLVDSTSCYEKDGTQVGKCYPSKLEPFYKFFKLKVMNVQSSIDDLIYHLGELELMKDSIETLIAIKFYDTGSCHSFSLRGQPDKNRESDKYAK